MGEHKLTKPRKCDKCGSEITTDADGIRMHSAECKKKQPKESTDK